MRSPSFKTRNPLYDAWRNMIYRCQMSTCADYKNYGGRGITVCERWRDFENFVADMGDRPSPEHQLDRIDNDGNYEPTNCRWATRGVQMVNRRKQQNNKSGYAGVSFDRKRQMWWAQIKRNNKRIYLGHFDTIVEAISARMSAEHNCKEQSARPTPTHILTDDKHKRLDIGLMV